MFLFFTLAYYASDNFLEPKAYNYMVRTFTAVKEGSDDIVLIVIDDKSIGRYRWPWRRNLYCGIYNYFKEYTKCRVIVSDSIVTSKDDTAGDKAYFDCLKNIENLTTGMSFSSKPYNDPKFGEMYDEAFKHRFAPDIEDLRLKADDYPFRSISIFPKDYFNSIKHAGAITTARGDDGYLRVAVSAINYKGTIYPSIALQTYMYLTGDTKLKVTDREITGEKVKIPLNRENSGMYTLLRFYKQNTSGGSYSHKTYSAVDIMDSYNELKAGRKPIINPAEFDGKIVMIGANVKAAATGLADIKRTPVSNEHSGLDVQAATLDNILNNYFMYELYDWQNILITLFLICTAFIIIRNYTLFISLSGIAFMVILYMGFCAFLYKNGYAVSIITPVSMVIITMIFAYSHRYILEDRNKEKIKTAMGKFISEDIMKNVVKNIDELKLGGKKANVTVLFADIRGFTSMSEKMSADEVSVILNEYFTEIEPIVTRYNGVINKFIGDAVMAIFGEPVQDLNHPKNAVRCAYAMLEKVKELQVKWLEEGKPKIEIGIGINTGEAFVGNIGSEKRMEYTVIGDTVNLASRIESNNKVYKTNLLISSTTYSNVRSIVDVVRISDVKIRGKEKALDLYEVIRLIG